MKGLTLRVPYAALMLYGKRETRTWQTPYRGKILLTSALKPYKVNELELITTPKIVYNIYETLKLEQDLIDKNQVPEIGFGMAYAIGELIDCFPMKHTDERQCYVKYSQGTFIHEIIKVKRIQPFPIKGKLNYWDVSEEVQKQIIYI